ncbi:MULTISPECIES: hypothetical protein [unclassified Mesorhizobium]|uniref:hypothetical protein n=1 Tax=unclassified Mesorhizobium TaxID=325217 RepID=UPI0013EB2611|nr:MULTISPECIES: hypothetical protein [unclassified Mesorhizobium]
MNAMAMAIDAMIVAVPKTSFIFQPAAFETAKQRPVTPAVPATGLRAGPHPRNHPFQTAYVGDPLERLPARHNALALQKALKGNQMGASPLKTWPLE